MTTHQKATNMQELPDLLALMEQTHLSPRGARAADRRLMRAIAASRYAIEHLRATCARMDWDLERGTVPARELSLHHSLRAHNAQELTRLERLIVEECAQLAELRSFKREVNATARQAKAPKAAPNPDYSRQAAYRARNREKLAERARARRALAKLLS